MVEQSVNVALELAERAVFLEKGEVRFSGRTVDLLDRPDILRSVFIAGAGSVEGTVVDARRRARPTSTIVPWRRPPSSCADNRHRVPPSAEAPAILECNGVRKTFGGITAIEDISLTLRDGEILGLIGHNGAGKTTFFDCVSGFLPTDGGRIRLGGVDIDAWPAHLRSAAGLGRTFQEARLFPSLTVAETIEVAQERHLASRDMVAAGLRLPASLDSEADGGAAGRGVDRDDGPGRVPREAGRRAVDGDPAHRRAGLRAGPGARRPPARRTLGRRGPARDRGDGAAAWSASGSTRAAPILVVEHDMPLLTAICDRMIALELGQVIAEGTPAEVLEHPAVIESYLGTDEATINRSGVKV